MEFVELYVSGIKAIKELSGLSDPILHAYSGLAVWLIASAATKKGLDRVAPLGVVVICELMNEIMGFVRNGYRDDIYFDFFHTLFWPLLLTIGFRLKLIRVDGCQLDQEVRSEV